MLVQEVPDDLVIVVQAVPEGFVGLVHGLTATVATCVRARRSPMGVPDCTLVGNAAFATEVQVVIGSIR